MTLVSFVVLRSAALAAAGAAVAVYPSLASTEETAKPVAIDARSKPPMVATVEAKRIGASERAFTGSVSALIQSNLGFRVPGKIVERLVDAGEEVKAGQPLMRVDDRDLRLALTAKLKAVDAARALAVQARADEARYATLLRLGQRHGPHPSLPARPLRDLVPREGAEDEGRDGSADRVAGRSPERIKPGAGGVTVGPDR